MDSGPAIDQQMSVQSRRGARFVSWAAVALGTALFCNAVWIGFLLWLAQAVLARL
jgi:hypothetical protein